MAAIYDTQVSSFIVKLCLLIAAIAFLAVSTAFSATLVVSNNQDDGDGSLRDAVRSNNSLGGLNTVVFSNTVTGRIVLTSGEIFVSAYVTILGPGPKLLAINGNGSNRVFHISGTNNLVNAVISGLTITNGFASSGGGVYNNHATLTLTNCVLVGNRNAAIYNDGAFSKRLAQLSLNACTIAGNTTLGNGGAIDNYGEGGAAFVGAIGCTFSSNVVVGNGVAGAVFNNGNFGLATCSLERCTVSGNSAAQAGAIWNTGFGGTGILSMSSCTISSNFADNAGMIFNNGFNGTARITINDTILTGGDGRPTLANDGGLIHSFGHNLSSDVAAGALTNSTDLINADPLLAPLRDNGGRTFTHGLLPGSPAIDKGVATGLTTDQRGEPRPFDFAAIANAAAGDGSDIGAFELGRPQLAVQRSTNSVVVSWLSNYAAYKLESATNLVPSTNWSVVTGSPTLNGTLYQQTVSPASGIRFYRLKL
jgi:hypothetical protein